jgi:hypothetical protein
MMKIILHIGSEKTGSTSIQSFLYSSRNILIENNVYYSTVNSSENHKFLVNYINAGPDNSLIRSNIKEQLYLDFECAKKFECNKFILSSELICTYANTFSKIKDLQLLISEFSEFVEVICYLRPQIDFHLSRIQTSIKGGIYKSISDFWSELNPNNYYYNYSEQFKVWSSVFGKEAVNFRSYLDKDVVDDFLRLIEVDCFNVNKIPVKNRGIDVDLLSILNSVNHANNSASIGHVNLFDNFKIRKPLEVDSIDAKRVDVLFHESNTEFLELNIDFPKNALSSTRCHSVESSNIGELDRFVPYGHILKDVFYEYNTNLYFFKFKAFFAVLQLALINADDLSVHDSYTECESIIKEFSVLNIENSHVQSLFDEYSRFKLLVNHPFFVIKNNL